MTTESENTLICSACEDDFFESDFDSIDDEYDENDNLCPKCSEAKLLKNAECDICGEQAKHSIGSAFYCDEHYEEVADGFAPKD